MFSKFITISMTFSHIGPPKWSGMGPIVWCTVDQVYWNEFDLKVLLLLFWWLRASLSKSWILNWVSNQIQQKFSWMDGWKSWFLADFDLLSGNHYMMDLNPFSDVHMLFFLLRPWFRELHDVPWKKKICHICNIEGNEIHYMMSSI